MAVRIVNDVLIASEKCTAQKFINEFERKYKFETIVYGPTNFLFFELQVIQDSDMSVSIHGDCKLNALSRFPINRYRPEQLSELPNDVELRSYRSVNISIGSLGTNAALSCAFYSSWMQQRAPSPTVQDLLFQINSSSISKSLELDVTTSDQFPESTICLFSSSWMQVAKKITVSSVSSVEFSLAIWLPAQCST